MLEGLREQKRSPNFKKYKKDELCLYTWKQGVINWSKTMAY
jgi:hypothetical protein